MNENNEQAIPTLNKYSIESVNDKILWTFCNKNMFHEL